MSKVNMLISVDEDTINECKVLFGQGCANNAEYAISQGIPIIDGDNEKAVEILRNYHNGYFGYKIDDVQKAHDLAIAALVTSSTRPTGDCISRSDLVQAFKEECCGNCHLCERFAVFENGIHHCGLIDNAQTVDLWQMRQEATENALKKAEVLYGRPKGEWKTVEGYDGDEYYECSNCGELWVLSAGTPKDNNMNFCPKCGADMKGGTK